MLSGKVPFQVRSSGNTADAIMKQIKSGHFDLQGPEWKDVSAAAKKLIKGSVSYAPDYSSICFLYFA